MTKQEAYNFHKERLLEVLKTLLRKPTIKEGFNSKCTTRSLVSEKYHSFINDCIDQLTSKNYLDYNKAGKLFWLAEPFYAYVINDDIDPFHTKDIGKKYYINCSKIIRVFMEYQAASWESKNLYQHTEKEIDIYYRGEWYQSFFEHVAPEKIYFNF
tara:strand:- start:847 stop:1314 length:468 start_codon:yes stop_codon:yes gene_type:complete